MASADKQIAEIRERIEKLDEQAVWSLVALIARRSRSVCVQLDRLELECVDAAIAPMVVKVIQENAFLSELKLGFSKDYMLTGLNAILDALKVCVCYTVYTISFGFLSLCFAQTNKTIKILNLREKVYGGGNIGDEGIKAIAAFLQVIILCV